MIRLLHGDCREVLKTLPDRSVQCCITSPPYFGLRDYDVAGQIGLEASPAEYIAEMVSVFAEVRRVLRDDGVVWLNLGDSYNNADKWGGGGANTGKHTREPDGTPASWKAVRRKWSGLDSKPKDLLMIPARVAIALQADGWYLRSDVIWHKPNPMPESVKGSHFTRHLVTMQDYERLSGLPYIDERAGEDWAGHMPDLSEIESPRGKAPLSAERKGDCDSEGTRGAARRSGEKADVRCVGKGIEEQRQIPPNEQGDSGRPKAIGELPSQTGGGRRHRDSSGLDHHSGAAQTPLLLLPEEGDADDARSRHSFEQGGAELPGERRSSVPLVQLHEAEQDLSDLLVGCPGCDKCVKHHGYLFHMSAGRPTSAHEHVFLLTKQARYFYDADAVRESAVGLEPGDIDGGAQKLPDGSDANPGRNYRQRRAKGNAKTFRGGGAYTQGQSFINDAVVERDSHGKAPNETFSRNLRNVWTIATAPFADAHFATFPPELAERCIKAGSRPGDTILDPFSGAGTTALVADRLNRNAIGVELNPAYAGMARNRIQEDGPLFAEFA